MGKELADMTLEELWELFPLSLVDHDSGWAGQYAEVEARLRAVLAGLGVERVSHVGSTAVDGIMAKDIVDVLVELRGDARIEDAAAALERDGFTRMSATGRRISLNLGYTKGGYAEKVYHIHLRRSGDNDELYFRDYLNDNPGVAKDYEALKLRLWKELGRDRDAYTEAKAAFVRKCTEAARAEYAGRYET